MIFDLKSLFTSVPTKEAMEAIIEIITKDSTFTECMNMRPEIEVDLLKLCLTTANFQFHNEHYELTNGLAMGAPAPPIIANIFMGKLEKALRSLKQCHAYG